MNYQDTPRDPEQPKRQQANPSSDLPLNDKMPEFLQGSAHPVACIFQFAFKVGALLIYIFFGLFSSDKMICYIFVLTLCAFDFWTVKNVTGRILVGLRWWSIIKEDGKEEWHFEALENSKYFFQFFSNFSHLM